MTRRRQLPPACVSSPPKSSESSWWTWRPNSTDHRKILLGAPGRRALSSPGATLGAAGVRLRSVVLDFSAFGVGSLRGTLAPVV
jgi:hypothetical protein